VKRKEKYSYEEFLEVCRKMRFKSVKDYHERRKVDERLPYHPRLYYPEFKFSHITGRVVGKYYSYIEFLSLCSIIKFKSKKDYSKRYKAWKGMPSRPEKIYEGFKYSYITGNKYNHKS